MKKLILFIVITVNLFSAELSRQRVTISATILAESSQTLPSSFIFPQISAATAPKEGVRSQVERVTFYSNSSFGQSVIVFNPMGDSFFLSKQGSSQRKIPFTLISNQTPRGEGQGNFSILSGQPLISTVDTAFGNDPTTFSQNRDLYLLISKRDLQRVSEGNYTGAIVFVHSTDN